MRAGRALSARLDRIWAALGARSSGARLVLWASLMGGAGVAMSALLLNFYLQALGLDAAEMGLVNAAPAGAALVAALPAGAVGDRIGRRPALIAAGLLAWSAALAFALAPAGNPRMTVAWLVAAGAGEGLAGAVLAANVAPFLAAEARAADRPRLFAAQGAAMTLAGVAGSAAGGYFPGALAAWLGGGARDLPALRGAFVAIVLLQALAVVPFALLLSRDWLRGATREGGAAAAPAGAPGTPPPGWLRLILPGTLVGLGAGQLLPFLNIYLAARFGLPFERLGFVFAGSALAVAAAMLVQPRMAARLGPVRATAWMQALSVPFLLLLGFAPTWPLALAALYARAALMNMAQPVWNAYVLEKVSPERQGAFTSLREMSWNAAWAAGAWWSGHLRLWLGFDAGFAAVYVSVAALYLLASALVRAWFADQSPS